MKSKRRLLTSKDEPIKKGQPSYIELFLYYVDYNPANINWIKIKKFKEEFAVDITNEQMLELHNIQFKLNLNEYL